MNYSLIELLIYMGLVKEYYNKIFSVLFLILCICRFLRSQITGSQLFPFTSCGPEGSCLAAVLMQSCRSYRWKYTRTDNDREADTLRKVRTVYNELRQNCLEYGQPQARVSLDERMVKAKGRFAFRYVKVSKI